MEGSALSILTLLSAVPLSYPPPEKTPRSQHIQSRPLWALLKDDSDEIVRHYAVKVIRTYTYIPFADSVAPTAQPEITGFHTYSKRKILSTRTNRIYAVERVHTSCLARYFSTTHSMPPKSAVMTPKPLAQPAAFDPVDFIAARSCSRRGA